MSHHIGAIVLTQSLEGQLLGGGDGRSPLDDMTEEEKEREAEQLHHLIEKMNAYATGS